MAITVFLSRSPGLLNRGPGGPASLGHGLHSSIFSPTNSNFLCTELYYCFTPTQFNLLVVEFIPLIPSTGCTCYLHRCISYFDSLARSEVNIQQSLSQLGLQNTQTASIQRDKTPPMNIYKNILVVLAPTFLWGEALEPIFFIVPTQGTIYQPLRSGRIWHKVNF